MLAESRVLILNFYVWDNNWTSEYNACSISEGSEKKVTSRCICNPITSVPEAKRRMCRARELERIICDGLESR